REGAVEVDGEDAARVGDLDDGAVARLDGDREPGLRVRRHRLDVVVGDGGGGRRGEQPAGGAARALGQRVAVLVVRDGEALDRVPAGDDRLAGRGGRLTGRGCPGVLRLLRC